MEELGRLVLRISGDERDLLTPSVETFVIAVSRHVSRRRDDNGITEREGVGGDEIK